MIVPTKNPREPKYIDATIINNTNKPIMINSFFDGFLNFIFHSQDNPLTGEAASAAKSLWSGLFDDFISLNVGSYKIN
jgi:hypothetical protein